MEGAQCGLFAIKWWVGLLKEGSSWFCCWQIGTSKVPVAKSASMTGIYAVEFRHSLHLCPFGRFFHVRNVSILGKSMIKPSQNWHVMHMSGWLGHWYLPRNLFFSLKAHTKSMTRCTDPNSAYWDFYLHFVSRPTLNLAIMQLLSTFSLHLHTRPSHPSSPVFPFFIWLCEILHRWPYAWAKEGHWHKDGGWRGVWDTCPCCLFIPSGPIWPQSQELKNADFSL